MISVAEALERVLALAAPLAPVKCPLRAALGRVLAEDVASDVDSPPHDKSMVDGYAVVASDLRSGVAELELLEEITAGNVPRMRVESGATSRIMTGAPIPAGSDAVVMIERSAVISAAAGADRIRLEAEGLAPGQNVMRRGQSLRCGETVLRSGAELRPVEIGLLAEVGCAAPTVRPRPRLAVLSTGDELVPLERRPAAGQIRNSNGPLLAALAERSGAAAEPLGVARDTVEQLRASIRRGLQADILVLSGGVSAGVLDLVPQTLADCGVREVFHRVRLKPGKPLWFGRVPPGGCLVFGLPGNPVGSLVCFELFVRPAIARLAGHSESGPERFEAELGAPFAHRGERPTYHPCRTSAGRVLPLDWKGSADLRRLADADCLACFPAGDRRHEAGERVTCLRLD